QRAQMLRDRLTTNILRDYMGDSGPVSISDRVEVARFSPHINAFGPTATQRQSAEIGKTQFAEVSAELDRLIDVEYRELMRALDEAGVPWTPGRGVPIAD
ncbi:MAG: hypothetical protein MJA83_17460, partial [Gammaproteobacteria bacterium]|nr:hypothetical protein [Gammaproteobacteria bacterium]